MVLDIGIVPQIPRQNARRHLARLFLVQNNLLIESWEKPGFVTFED